MAVTRINYIHGRNCRTIGTMISLIWGIAIIVSLAPLFGWRDPNFEEKVNNDKMCIVSQELSYQIFATMTCFYAPLVIILLLYWRIFMTARTRLRKRLAAKANVGLHAKSKKGAGSDETGHQGAVPVAASPAVLTNVSTTNGGTRKESIITRKESITPTPKKHSVVVEQNTSGGQPTTRIEIEDTEADAISPGGGSLAASPDEAEPLAMPPTSRFVSQGCQTERSMINHHNHYADTSTRCLIVSCFSHFIKKSKNQ